ncbi:MAG: AbrB/MazE/SpoVT family DNA-binding domain-containing protein [Chloroflexi bacterium]|nr:AbrB/MazE/SpoVT family DNA-binding domain-containing protein [Chloroflexota bacterium]
MTFQLESDTIILRNIGQHDETLERPQEVRKVPTYSKVTRHGQITLPAPVRKSLGIEEGDLVEIEVIDEKAVLVPKRLVDKSQAYFWTKKWQEGEQEADEDIKTGRVKVFDSAEELVKDLE